jgi:carboxypeptidase PM20D1
MKRFFLAVLVIVILFAFVLIINTLRFESKQPQIDPIELVSIDDSAKFRMSKAISIPTISHEDPANFDSAAFDQFMVFLEESYPLSHREMKVTPINTYSRIFKWEGTDSALKPIILMGHLDVVPVPEENLSEWREAPFAQTIKDGIIWGRGAIDDKISVIGNLEATEQLISEGYQPQRTIYLCFGHDEELGGLLGAIPIVDHLQNQGVKAAFVLDEGFAITQKLTPGVDQDLAMIGTAEKGFVSLTLSIKLEGGHSSMPDKESAIDVLSRAIVKLKDNPFPATITEPVGDFMDHVGPEMPFGQKLAFANRWALESMIIGVFEGKGSGNAMIRTTTAPTIINAGIKENVIPYEARATVNFRILPGTSIEEVKIRVAETIDDDRISITEGEFSSEAPQSSPTDSEGYRMIQQTIHEIFPNTLTSPNLVIGATDSRYYYPLTPNVYRFTPFYLNEETLGTFHGIDERISVTDFENAIRYYRQLMINSSM